MPLRQVDVAHPPMRSAEAEVMLDELLRELRGKGPGQALKVIHGHGGSGVLKETVRNWAWRNRFRLHGVVPGESYAITDPPTVAMRAVCGQEPDPDLGQENPGITVLWIS